MPVDSMFWSGSWSRDLHLLAGQTSVDLSAMALAFQDGAANAFAAAYMAAHKGAVKLSFQPLFKGVPTTSSGRRSGHVHEPRPAPIGTMHRAYRRMQSRFLRQHY